VKIGYSEVLDRRWAQLSPLLPGLRVVGYVAGTRADEARLHKRFAAHRERGEWFRTSDELRSYLGTLKLHQFSEEPKRGRWLGPSKPVHMLLEEDLPREVEEYRFRHRLPRRTCARVSIYICISARQDLSAARAYRLSELPRPEYASFRSGLSEERSVLGAPMLYQECPVCAEAAQIVAITRQNQILPFCHRALWVLPRTRRR
jgi:hypothetical protein